MDIIPVYGVFLKSHDKDEEDVMIFMAYSEEAADAKIAWHSRHTGEFLSRYYFRRIDQQEEYDRNGRLLYGD